LNKKDRARDKRLQKSYGWSLRRVKKLDKAQKHRCGICGRLPKKAPLNVDHKHFKVAVRRRSKKKGWIAQVKELNRPPFKAKFKKDAIRLAKQDALPHAVRGLLCAGRYAGCNRLIGRIDNIPWLKKVIAYLENPPAKRIFNGRHT
jgi:hypothetical protein